MNSCVTSVATACNKTQFSSTYLTAHDCIKTIFCNTSTKEMPPKCNIKAEQIVNVTRNCTNKDISGTFSYCMSYVKENISSVVSDCLDQEQTTAAVTTATTTTIETLATDEGTTTSSSTTTFSSCPLILAERPILVRSTTEPPVSPVVTPAVTVRKRRLYL